jgi:predicted RecB family nuclease
MVHQLLTPSKITAWLECAHYLTLKHQVDSGELTAPASVFGEMARMLMSKGLAHEEAVLERYCDDGFTVFEVPDRMRTVESFAEWVDRVGDGLNDGHEVIFQMPFVHDGIRGIADFLERVEYDDGTWTYEPVDAKLARAEAKPGHVLQLCFYAEAIAGLTGRMPEYLHIELGSGERETIRADNVMAYWRRLRTQLARVVADSPRDPTVPEPCAHCDFCEFSPTCEAAWRGSDSPVHVAKIRKTDLKTLAD